MKLGKTTSRRISDKVYNNVWTPVQNLIAYKLTDVEVRIYVNLNMDNIILIIERMNIPIIR